VQLNLFLTLWFVVGIVIGVAYLVTFAMSIGAIIQPAHVTIGLVALNWTLLGDAVLTLIVGTFIWFYTLRERAEFGDVFDAASTEVRQAVQDTVRQHSRTVYFTLTIASYNVAAISARLTLWSQQGSALILQRRPARSLVLVL
jgi:hypothetical protein